MGSGRRSPSSSSPEMIGVKAGCWYLQCPGLGGLFEHVCRAVIVMSLLCSGRSRCCSTRDRLLVWQKGVVKW